MAAQRVEQAKIAASTPPCSLLVEIAASTARQRRVRVGPGDKLQWEFTEAGESSIEFSVLFVPATPAATGRPDGPPDLVADASSTSPPPDGPSTQTGAVVEVVLEKLRCKKYVGSYSCGLVGGVLVFGFSNEFSWWKSKTIDLTLQLQVADQPA